MAMIMKKALMSYMASRTVANRCILVVIIKISIYEIDINNICILFSLLYIIL